MFAQVEEEACRRAEACLWDGSKQVFVELWLRGPRGPLSCLSLTPWLTHDHFWCHEGGTHHNCRRIEDRLVLNEILIEPRSKYYR